MFKKLRNLDEATKVNLSIIAFGIFMIIILTQIR